MFGRLACPFAAVAANQLLPRNCRREIIPEQYQTPHLSAICSLVSGGTRPVASTPIFRRFRPACLQSSNSRKHLQEVDTRPPLFEAPRAKRVMDVLQKRNHAVDGASNMAAAPPMAPFIMKMSNPAC